jgi:hypothetical protein
MSPRRVGATILSRVSIRVFVVGALAQGAAILLADPSRFASPGYSVIRQVPGGMDTWAVALLIGGLVALVGSLTLNFRVKGAGLFLVAIWFFAFGAGAFAAIVANPNAGPTGPVPYFICGYCAAGLVLIDERRRAR